VSPKTFNALAWGAGVVFLLGITLLLITGKSTDEEILDLLAEAQVERGEVSAGWGNRLKGIESGNITARQKYAIQNLKKLIQEYTEHTRGEESRKTFELSYAVKTYLSGEEPLPNPTPLPPTPTRTPIPTRTPYPSDARVYAKEFILDRLRAPSTAKFPWGSEFTVTNSGKIWVVKSYVDAQNGFGAMIRTHFTVKMEHLGGSGWRLLDLQTY